MSLLHHLLSFISKYGQIPPEDIDLPENDYILSFFFDGFETNLLFQYKYVFGDEYHIKITNTENDYEPCLHLVLYEKSSIIHGDVYYVNSNTSVCQIPLNRGGTWLLELAQSLFCKFEVQVSSLEDASRVLCNRNKRLARLAMIRIYAGKRSWYENFGYQIDFSTLNFGPEEYDHFISTLINLPMDAVTKEISQIDKTAQQFPQLYAARHVLFKYPLLEKETLGTYMSRMWKRDCSSYMIMDNFFNLSSRTDTNYSWSLAYYSINLATKKMIKKKWDC